MITLKVLNEPYFCRTKDQLWYQETRTAIDMIIKENKTFEDIGEAAEKSNLFNASSVSRATDIRRAVVRRIHSVDKKFLNFFSRQNSEVQLQLCIAMVMLTDHTFFDFMDSVYREKLIKGDFCLKYSDLIGFLHSLQDRDQRASKWTDVGMKDIAQSYRSMLKEAGMASETGRDRKIIRPLISRETEDFLKEDGLEYIYKILAGERE